MAGEFLCLANEDFYNVKATTIYDLLDAKHLLYRTTSGITLLRPIEALMTATTTSSRAPSTVPTPNGLPLYTVVSMFPLCSSTLIPPNTKLYDANNTFADHVKSDPLPEHSYLVPDMRHNSHDPSPTASTPTSPPPVQSGSTRGLTSIFPS